MASPEQQIEFLSNLQRLLAEGSFVSTYKYALLLSLADLCIEHGRDDDAPLTIPTRLIGEKFADYYWRQSAPYLPAGGAEAGVLKQNTGEPPRIVKLLNEVRGAYEGSLAILRHDEQVWKQTVMQIAAQVRKMPLWKLQTVGTQKLDFLYDNTGSGSAVTLKPGVCFCFRKHYPPRVVCDDSRFESGQTNGIHGIAMRHIGVTTQHFMQKKRLSLPKSSLDMLR